MENGEMDFSTLEGAKVLKKNNGLPPLCNGTGAVMKKRHMDVEAGPLFKIGPGSYHMELVFCSCNPEEVLL